MCASACARRQKATARLWRHCRDHSDLIQRVSSLCVLQLISKQGVPPADSIVISVAVRLFLFAGKTGYSYDAVWVCANWLVANHAAIALLETGDVIVNCAAIVNCAVTTKGRKHTEKKNNTLRCVPCNQLCLGAMRQICTGCRGVLRHQHSTACINIYIYIIVILYIIDYRLYLRI